jgi:hypothetical protein
VRPHLQTSRPPNSMNIAGQQYLLLSSAFIHLGIPPAPPTLSNVTVIFKFQILWIIRFPRIPHGPGAANSAKMAHNPPVSGARTRFNVVELLMGEKIKGLAQPGIVEKIETIPGRGAHHASL